ncbi:MAG: hypothetical protein ABIK82_09335 [Pseudomonadota bacterium]
MDVQGENAKPKRVSNKPRKKVVNAASSESRQGASSEIEQVLANLTGCLQTTEDERRELDALIKGVVGRHPGEQDVIDAVMRALSQWAMSKGMYFRGAASSFHKDRYVWHTKQEGRLRYSLAKSIGQKAKGSDDRAFKEANEIMNQLRAFDRWRVAVTNNSGVALHFFGAPFWIADPDSGKPHPSVKKTYYPARAGLAPDIDRKYVLLQLKIPKDASVPRFADSNGYPYWRPGGRTYPIEGCPAELSGFDEAVTNGVTLGCVAAEPHFFNRSV